MTYNKPEIVVLGEAGRLIQAGSKPSQLDDGSNSQTIVPAYELDEEQ